MKRFTVSSDGFHGFLHTPEADAFPGKAVIVVGGSEGNDQVAVGTGRRFAENGIHALGVCYWNAPGLPGELIEVPAESIENAVKYLKVSGFEKIAMYGISKGGELTLLAASLIPEITCAVAVCPLHVVMAGIKGNGSTLRKGFANRSSFTWRGKPLPFVPARTSIAGVLWRLITKRQIEMQFMYEKALTRAPEQALIPVEKINGPILLICPEDDSMWPSDTACAAVEQRLKGNKHPFPVKRLTYKYASHILVPMDPSMLRFFKIERKFPKECAKSRTDAFEKTISFLSEW